MTEIDRSLPLRWNQSWLAVDARAEVQFAARRRARRRAVDDPVLSAAMAEQVGVVAAISRQHIVAGAAEQHVTARAAGGVRVGAALLRRR